MSRTDTSLDSYCDTDAPEKFLIVNDRHWDFLQYIFPDKIEKTIYAIFISWQKIENIVWLGIFYDKEFFG